MDAPHGLMSRLSPRLDVLPAAQRAMWPHLRDVKTLGWVLYGGTAIALETLVAAR